MNLNYPRSKIYCTNCSTQMNELPLTKAFSLQKIINDIETLDEEGAKKIAKDFARLYFTTQQTWINFTNWKIK